ncbi:cardiolipin synthase B, partial [Streptomyces sp. NPDC001822]
MTSHTEETSTPSRYGDALHSERTVRLRRRLERLIGIAATEGNEVVPLRNGDEIFAAML